MTKSSWVPIQEALDPRTYAICPFCEEIIKGCILPCPHCGEPDTPDDNDPSTDDLQ